MGGTSTSSRKDIQELVHTSSTPLKKGHMCADWLVMRRFRVTETATAQLKLRDEELRQEIGLLQWKGAPQDRLKCPKKLADG